MFKFNWSVNKMFKVWIFASRLRSILPRIKVNISLDINGKVSLILENLITSKLIFSAGTNDNNDHIMKKEIFKFKKGAQ